MRSCLLLCAVGAILVASGCSNSDSGNPGSGTSGAAGTGGSGETATGSGGASGSAAGAGGSTSTGGNDLGGSMGTAGTSVTDAGDASTLPPLDGGGLSTDAAAGFASSKSYQCNIITGVSVTYDWFTSGFGAGLDATRWEALAPAQADIAFIQIWADPNSTLWTMTKRTPCAQHADNPDRVIFTGVNWDYTTAAQWVTQYEAVLKVIQAKFSGVKEVDLMTMLRAPNNMSCGSVETVVQPFIDDAIQTMVAKYPTLVRAAPKVYAPNCNVFTGGGPHYTTAGKQAVAKVYSDTFAAEP